MQSLPVGAQLFEGLTRSNIVDKLRSRLRSLGVPQAEYYRTHDFRRGHAEDLCRSGASLREILRAGEWKSPAFMAYLDLDKLERDLVVQAHLDESGDEE